MSDQVGKFNPASKSLKEYGQFQRTVMLFNMVTGATIWAAARLIRSEVAPEGVYGGFINHMPAEVWAIPLLFGAALWLVGSVVNGSKRWKPWVTPSWRLLGAILCTLVMAMFAGGCIYGFTQGVEPELFVIVQTVQSFAFGAAGLSSCRMAYSDLKAGLRNGRGA